MIDTSSPQLVPEVVAERMEAGPLSVGTASPEELGKPLRKCHGTNTFCAGIDFTK